VCIGSARAGRTDKSVCATFGSRNLATSQPEHATQSGGAAAALHNRRMKRLAMLTLLVIATTASAQPAKAPAGNPPPPPPSGCSAATLKGDYIFAQDGFLIAGKDAKERVPFAVAGRDVFDGAGKVRGTITISENGVIKRTTYKATYTLSGECTGSLTATDATGKTTHYDIFVQAGGDSLVWVETDPGTVSAGWEHRRMSPPPRPPRE